MSVPPSFARLGCSRPPAAATRTVSRMLDKLELMVRPRPPHCQVLVSTIRPRRAQIHRETAPDVRIGQTLRSVKLSWLSTHHDMHQGVGLRMQLSFASVAFSGFSLRRDADLQTRARTDRRGGVVYGTHHRGGWSIPLHASCTLPLKSMRFLVSLRNVSRYFPGYLAFRAILTRWKSQVRIPRRPVALRQVYTVSLRVVRALCGVCNGRSGPSDGFQARQKVHSMAVDLDAWQQHRSARSSSHLMGHLPRQGNPPQPEWAPPADAPAATVSPTPPLALRSILESAEGTPRSAFSARPTWKICASPGPDNKRERARQARQRRLLLVNHCSG